MKTMKLQKLATTISLSLCLSLPALAADLKTETDKTSYALGASVGNYISGQVYQQLELGAEVNMELLITGFTDALKDKQQLTDEQILDLLNQRAIALNEEREARFAKLAEENLKAGEAFLAENKKKSGVKVTDSGLQYEVLSMGKGKKPNPEDVVTVNYVGKLIDGTVFEDSSKNKAAGRFALMTVIPGWEEGLRLMPEGSKFRFVIPAKLAYGEQAPGVIPPQATLVFEVELVKVEKPGKDSKHPMPGHG
ncbi:FKBP-type peptidyl-prolyl cis-trans isomerase [Shewanella algae]|uniref:FKBP-type peptidyl-prolyl cis-trans isomerase n=1 Tax=Shewanella algae TaxID=38313 RepID=UPI00313D7C31